MAEGVGLAASLLTIAKLASLLWDVSHDIYRISRNRDAIREEIRFISHSMRTASDSFEIALETIRHRTIPDNQSAVFQQLKTRGTLRGLEKSAKYIKRQVTDIPASIQSTKSWAAFLEAYKWNHKHRAKVMQSIKWIQLVQTSVEIILNAAQFESNQHDAMITADRVYQARLEKDKYVLLLFIY